MTVKSIKIYKNTIFKNKKGNLIKYISTKNSFLISLVRYILTILITIRLKVGIL